MPRCKGVGRRGPNGIFAVFLIGAGVLLFLSNLGFLPIRNVWDYWPLIFVAMGLGRLTRTPSFSAFVLGGLLVLFGFIFTLVNTGVIPIRTRDNSWPLSLLFIAVGIGGLAKVLEAGNARWRNYPFGPGSNRQAPSDVPPPASPPPLRWPTSENWAGWSKPSDSDDSPVLENIALMSTIRRKIESQNFQGGTLSAFLGSIELDLRRSRPPEGRNTIRLDANTIMGSIKLRIPETWRVDWNGVNMMASFEDKTVPPIIGAAAPQLIMTGYSFMGSIEIES
jgi:hypothetical protein